MCFSIELQTPPESRYIARKANGGPTQKVRGVLALAAVESKKERLLLISTGKKGVLTRLDCEAASQEIEMFPVFHGHRHDAQPAVLHDRGSLHLRDSWAPGLVGNDPKSGIESAASDMPCNKSELHFHAGKGDAFGDALTNAKHVSKVEWYTLRPSGIAGRIGAKHSYLAFTMQGDAEPMYIMENTHLDSACGFPFPQQSVRISFRKDVVNVGKLLHSTEVQIRRRTMHQLQIFAAGHAANNNSHHFALAVFNNCLPAYSSGRVKRCPNSVHTLLARIWS